MKDSKFIELLNLYVDHEITAADAALLEAEIERDPGRRSVYRQYCLMQKGCTVLAHDFRANETPESADVIQFPVRRRMSPTWGYVGGLVAAAACVAFVFVGRSRVEEINVQAQGRGAVAISQPVTVQTVPVADFAAAAQAQAKVTRPALQPVFAGLTNSNEPETALAENNQLDWMNRVQMERVPVEDVRFDSREDFKQDLRLNRPRQTFKAQVEMTAFQFQR